MRKSRILLIVLGVVLVLLGAGVLYARPLLETGTGYAAHNACAIALVAGRDPVAAEQDLPPNPLVPLMLTDVDLSEGTATSSVLGLFAKTAHYVPGAGCTLADAHPTFEGPPSIDPLPADAEWPEGSAVADPPDDIDVDAVTAAVDLAFADTAADGEPLGTRAVVVVHDGRIVAERYADGFTADTPQLGWSMAKSVTNAMVGRLVAAGDLDVEEAGLREGWTDERAEITVDHLLRMASGLEWDETYDLGTTITEMLYDTADMGAFAAAQPLEFRVGTHQEYSSGATNILCDVLHDRTGMGVEMAHELVFEPLGMTSAVLEPDAGGDLVCSSYLWATPRDWARFGLWFLQEGEWGGEQLLPSDWIDYSTDPVAFGSGEEEGHAAHWWVNRSADGDLRFPEMPEDAYWASGHDGQRVVVVPSADLVVVRTGFTPTVDGDDIGVDALVADLVAAVGS